MNQSQNKGQKIQQHSIRILFLGDLVREYDFDIFILKRFRSIFCRLLSALKKPPKRVVFFESFNAVRINERYRVELRQCKADEDDRSCKDRCAFLTSG